MFNEFKKFIQRGNVLDLAIAVVMGAAFGKIVSSLVDGVIMPPIGLLLGKVDFSSLFFILDSSKGIPASLAEAKAKGIPVVAYGHFINEVINFLIIAAVVFLLVRQVNRFTKKAAAAPPPPDKKDCPYCFSTISLKAVRCPHCTSELESGLLKASPK